MSKYSIIGSWKLVSTTRPDFKIAGHYSHFTSDGIHTTEHIDVSALPIGVPYRIEGISLIFLWTQFGRKEIRNEIEFEGPDFLKVIDHNGFIWKNRRLKECQHEMKAFVNQKGILEPIS